MRLIDADKLRQDNPLCTYCGYRQSDIDAAETVDAVTRQQIRDILKLTDDLRKTIKPKSAVVGFDLACDYIKKMLEGAT